MHDALCVTKPEMFLTASERLLCILPSMHPPSILHPPRLDSAETLSRFSSGFSGADQTTVVLDKSASWRQRAGGAAAAGKGSFRGGGEGGAAAGAGGGSGGSSIYANFAPLEQLVDAALTESAPGTGGPGSWRVSGASNQMGLLGPGVVPTIGQAGGRTSGQLSRAPSTHTSHKVALGYMLQPDYIHNTTLSRWVIQRVHACVR